MQSPDTRPMDSVSQPQPRTCGPSATSASTKAARRQRRAETRTDVWAQVVPPARDQPRVAHVVLHPLFYPAPLRPGPGATLVAKWASHVDPHVDPALSMTSAYGHCHFPPATTTAREGLAYPTWRDSPNSLAPSMTPSGERSTMAVTKETRCYRV